MIGVNCIVVVQVVGVVDVYGVQLLCRGFAEIFQVLELVVHCAFLRADEGFTSVCLRKKCSGQLGMCRSRFGLPGSIAQACAEIHRHENFVRGQFDGKVGAGNLCVGQVGVFDLGFV